jgi:hypothetical protein
MSRVLAIPPFGSGHDPAGAAAPGRVVLVGAALSLLHAATSMVIETSAVAGTSSRTPGRAREASFVFIRLTALP